MITSSKGIKLTSKHQLTVPASVARALGLQAGDTLDYTLTDGALVLRPRPTLSQRLGDLWAENSKRNKGTASDASIKRTIRNYYAHQRND